MKKSNTRVEVGKRIRVLREANNLSKRQLGIMLDMDREHIADIEAGKGNPTMSTLERIAHGLNVEVSDFFAD